MNRIKIGVFLALAAGLMLLYPLPAGATGVLILKPDEKLILGVNSGKGILAMTEKNGVRTFRLAENAWATVQSLPDGSTLVKSIKGPVKVVYKVNTIFIPARSQASFSLLRSVKRLKVSVPEGAAEPILVTSRNTSIVLENGQGVIISQPDMSRVFVSVTKESIKPVNLTICRTLARLQPRGEISATIGESTTGVLIRVESGIVDFIKDNGEMVVLNSGQTINDTCTPPPADVLAVPEEVVISPSAP